MIETIFYGSLPHICLLLIGFTVVYPMTLNSGLRVSRILSLPLCYLVGELLITQIFLVNSHIFGSFLATASISFCCIGGAIFFIHGCRSKRPTSDEMKLPYTSRAIVIALATLLVFILPNVGISFFEPLTQWDARSIWFFHGKAFYFDDHVSIEYLKNPEYLWSHPDYPPLVPLLSAYHAYFGGGWSEVTNKSFLFFHWLALLWLFFLTLGYLNISCAVSLLCCVIIQLFFSNNAMVGFADSGWALAFTIGCVSLLASFRLQGGGQKKSAVLFLYNAFVLLAICSLIKLEGFVSTLVLIVSFGLLLFLFNRGTLNRFLFLTLLYGFLVSNWFIFVQIHGIHGEYEHSMHAVITLGTEMLMVRVSQIVAFVLSHLNWPFWQWTKAIIAAAVLLPVLTLVGNSWNTRERTESLFVSIVILALCFLLLIAYLSTPLDLGWHLTTSFPRTASAIYMLCLVSLGLLCRRKESAE